MANLPVEVQLIGKDQLTPVLNKSESALESLTKGFFAFNQAQQAISTVSGAIGGFAQSLTAPAMEMEAARARIQAFTKDSAQTEAILKAVRAEADKTPFSFGEMASAAASLGPQAKKAGVDLSSLLQTAEALNASDPAQGFEGAVMALREALGGDFMSLRERFEVDTKAMAAAVKEGVPPIEAINKGLAEQGINLDMVRNLANTTAGRISTFNDTLEGLRRTAGEEILKGFGTQLDNVSKLMTDNMDVLQELARAFGQGLAAAIALAGSAFEAILPLLRDILVRLASEAPRIIQNFQAVVTDLTGQMALFSQMLVAVWQASQPVIAIIAEQMTPVFDFLARNINSVVIPALIAFGAVAAAQAAATIIAMGPVVLPIAAIGLAIMLLNEAWSQNWGDIQGKTQAVVSFLQTNVFPPLMAAINWFAETGLPALKIGWDTTWTGIQTTFTNVWNAIQTVISTIWPIVEKIIVVGDALVLKDWSAAWTGIGDVFRITWETIQRLMGELVQAVLNALSQLATDAWNKAKAVGEGIVNGIADTIKDLGGRIKDGLLEAVKGALDAAADAVRNFKLPGLSLPQVSLPSPSGRGGGEPVQGGDVPQTILAGIQKGLGFLGSQAWNGLCEKFIGDMLGTRRYPTAWADALANRTNTGFNPPPGQLVFFRPDASNQGAGHVGISLGGNRFLSATASGVKVDDLGNSYWSSLYAGFGPPRYARGVKGHGGGPAIVGEEGWEIVDLPRGSNVYSHQQSKQMVGVGGGTHIHFHGPVYGMDDFESKVVEINERSGRRGR